MAFPHGAAAAGHSISGHNPILAAAAGGGAFYQPAVLGQDVQPDRPIGYGAFGVVW